MAKQKGIWKTVWDNLKEDLNKEVCFHRNGAITTVEKISKKEKMKLREIESHPQQNVGEVHYHQHVHYEKGKE